jgi:hypothetical protein
MIRLAGIASLALLSAGELSPSANASLVLDQQYLLNNATSGFTPGLGGGFRRAETFTVGVAGTLSQVDVIIGFGPPLTGLNILSTSAGVPTTTVVGTGTLLSQSSSEADFSVSLPVSIGEVLAIEPFSSTNNGGGWLTENPGTYPGGGDFFLNPGFGINNFTPSGNAEDFRTFVTVATAVPEPASLTCLASGFAFLLALRRRRRC